MQGTLSASFGLADVVKGIYVGRRSGILHVHRGPVEKRLFFEKGSFVFSESNDPDWRIGALLVKMGRVSAEDLERVLQLLAPRKRIGAVLVSLGCLDAETLNQAVQYQITENVYPVFSWTDGDFEFEEREQPAPSDIAFSLSTANLIMEGIRRIDDPAFVAQAIGPTDQVVALGSNPLLRFQAVFLKPQEGFILSRIDGLLTIDEVCSITPVPPEHVLRCLYGLKSAGVLEIRGSRETAAADAETGDIAGFFSDFGGVEQYLGRAPQAAAAAADLAPEESKELEEIEGLAARISSLTYYEVLGVPAGSDEKAVRKAYYRLAKTYHPDRHHRGHLAGVQDKLERIFVRVNEAYETLRDERRRIAYDARLAAPQGASSARPESWEEAPVPHDEAGRKKSAEDAFREGKRLFDQGDYFGSIRLLRLAVKGQPDRPGFRAYLGRALGKNPKWRKEAEEHLLKAIELEPAKADHYAQLGAIYLEAGLVAKAERHFAEALNWDPQNATAREGRSRLEAQKKGAAPGLGGTLRSIFGEKK